MPSSAGDRKRRSSALTGLTTKKKTAAAIATNWITAVMNAPYRNTAPLIVNVRPLKSGFPKIIAMIGITRSFTSELTTAANAIPITNAIASHVIVVRIEARARICARSSAVTNARLTSTAAASKTIAVPIPARKGPSVLIDAGANADCRAEHLLQFATMGAVFAEEILDIARPSVRLLSIGEEPEKGNQLTLEAHELLSASDLDFRGNAEGRDVLEGAADVLVTDGFTGNVALKAVEGTIRTLLDSLREEITASTTGTVGGLLIRPAARRLRKRLDPDTYGGAYLLGLRGLVVIAHGNSSATAIANAIRLAARGVDHDVVGRLATRLSRAQGAEIV